MTRREHYDLGMTFPVYVGDPSSTYDLVREYMEGFGWRGLRSADIARVVRCSKRSVDEALDELCAEGTVRYEREATWGGKGKSRKRWFPCHNRVPTAYEDLTPVHDSYFGGVLTS